MRDILADGGVAKPWGSVGRILRLDLIGCLASVSRKPWSTVTTARASRAARHVSRLTNLRITSTSAIASGAPVDFCHGVAVPGRRASARISARPTGARHVSARHLPGQIRPPNRTIPACPGFRRRRTAGQGQPCNQKTANQDIPAHDSLQTIDDKSQPLTRSTEKAQDSEPEWAEKVRDVAEAQVFEMALVENLQREDLNPIDEAERYQHLVAEFGYTQESLAARVGKERSTVANALRLLCFPERENAR